MRRLFVALVLAAFLTVGCSSSDAPPASPDATVTPGSPAPAGRPVGKRRPVVLEAKALVLAVDDATTNELPFGEAGVATAQGELDRVALDGTLERTSDCGAGPQRVLTYPGFSVYFLNDKLAGWAVRFDDTSGLTTSNGISLTSTREQVQDTYDGEVKVFESTLGTEWTAPDGISGLFEDDSPSATVETFWSGSTCIAR